MLILAQPCHNDLRPGLGNASLQILMMLGMIVRLALQAHATCTAHGRPVCELHPFGCRRPQQQLLQEALWQWVWVPGGFADAGCVALSERGTLCYVQFWTRRSFEVLVTSNDELSVECKARLLYCASISGQAGSPSKNKECGVLFVGAAGLGRFLQRPYVVQ